MSQSPAWRVFDGPQAAEGSAGAGAAGAPGTGGASSAGALAPDRRLALAGLAGAAAIGAVALVIAVSGGGTTTIEGPEPLLGAVPSGSADAAPGDELVVDVAGAVVNPGLYRLGTGARVGDAIEAAGGFGPRVDVDRVGIVLNLAATLTDGAQIRVPSRDDPSAPPAVGGGGSGGSGGGSGGGGLVNLNTATESELDTLPGIGPVTAAKIIEARTTAPFRTVEELREREIVGEKTFENLRDLVTVG
jgi:competence protein ComEA